MLDVSYEEVVDNLEEQARRLINYCGLPWDDRCLSFDKTNRPITTPSNVQVRQPLYRSSVARGAATKPISSRCWSNSKAAAGLSDGPGESPELLGIAGGERGQKRLRDRSSQRKKRSIRSSQDVQQIVPVVGPHGKWRIRRTGA